MSNSLLPIGIYRILERSMEPSIHEGSYVIVNHWFRSLSPGEVVVALDKTGIHIVKRIKSIGRSGLFLLGDNLSRSVDSRKFGPIGRNRIIGKVVAVV